jgi:hypothetical protein
MTRTHREDEMWSAMDNETAARIGATKCTAPVAANAINDQAIRREHRIIPL